MISIGCFNFNLPAVGIRHAAARAQGDEVPLWMARRKKNPAPFRPASAVIYRGHPGMM